jgi:hypothetical protein
MATTINADDGAVSGSAGLKYSSDSTGVLALQTNGTTAVSISASQAVTLTNALAEASGGTGTTTGYYGFKNRIINGAMVIDQRSAGASVTPTANFTYTLDRWVAGLIQSSKFSVQQSSTAPAGFSNSILITSLSAYSVLSTDYFNINQFIEGFNWADLDFGTANAQTVTLSFWVRSSLTGTFGGALANSAGSRAYPFTYTINAANTWEKETITIAGDTTGTWVGATNGIGARLWISLGTGSSFATTADAWAAGNFIAPTGATSVVGTSGATFYITGVQLEKGSTATSFDYRPYTTELALAQRYYEIIGSTAGSLIFADVANASSIGRSSIFYKLTKRASPTVTINGTWTYSNASALTVDATGIDTTRLSWTITAAGINYIFNSTAGDNISISSEL